MKMSIVVKLVCLMLCIVSSRSITVRNGAYENFVIEIQKDIGEDDCSQFISNLEKILTSSSQYLHSSLDGRMYFASIDIILPSTWSNNCVSNATVTSYNGAPSDVQITKSHPIFGDDLWTQQSSGCGERGDQMFVSERAIRNDFENVEKKFTNEFMKYRYGVFDVNGFEGDPIYPKCSASSSLTCSDAMNIEGANRQNSIAESFNKYMPTKQNQMCDRMTRMDVILRNIDFNNTQRNQNFATPVFNYVRKMSTRYMVILDDHIDISIRDSYIFLKDALRKWLEKDLVHHGTEVGIMKLHSNTSKTLEVIKHIAGSDDREEILSNLPWYINNRATQSKCNIQSRITQSIVQMQERSKIYGDAISSIVLIAPGMYKCTEEVINEIVDAANEANIKFVTINYPNIGPNRVPMDELAIRTNGAAFTVMERKRNEEQSLLSTFFELTNVLMHVSSLYHHGDQSELPVEIYRKEIIDTSNSGDAAKSRTTIDSFNVDDATKNINFFTYIYDRKDIGMFLDNGMSLTSPSHNTFSTFTELRAEYHQLTIVGNLTGVGSWSYNIKRFYGNPQPHFVQVLAYPQPDTNSFIRARAWIRRPQNGGPNVIYAEVMQGNLPIIDALVEATVMMPNGREEKIQLYDSGSGDPDVTRGDGIYSRYFAIEDAGIYKFQITVSDNGNVAYSQMDRDPSVDIHCCGSAIITTSKQPVTPFTRHLIPITLFISQEEIDQERQVLPFIGRIGDLHVVSQNNGSDRVTLEWTSPDTGAENSKVEYEIRYATSLKDVVDHFDTIATKWNLIETIPHTVGQGASVTLNLSDEPSLIGVPFYVAIRSINGDVSTGPISNFVRIFVPKRRPTASPSYTHIDNYYETDPSMEPMDDDEHVGIFQHNKLAAIPWEILIPVIICCIIALIIIIVYCWCCVSRKRGFNDTKKPTKSPSKPSISVITPSTPSYQPQPVQQNQYHVDPVSNGSVHSYLVDIPDHHTVGLPMIDDDILKPDFTDHDKMLIEEMKQQQRFQQQQQQALLDAYGDQQTILTSTLTRNGQYLSPYESWSASTLLHEHEVRQESPHDNSNLMYVDANGDLVPAVPPHPYQHSNGYGYTTDSRGPPPPTYSQVYRPLVRGMPGQGSMQSVVSSAMMNGTADKKIRNVTMV